MRKYRKGFLLLENGDVFEGNCFGSFKNENDNSTIGEVVFNTGMVGYPETLTDPSYRGQILVFTYPLIGNYGVFDKSVNEYNILEHFESNQIQIEGLVLSELTNNYQHSEGVKSLDEWLIEENIPGIFGIDTRKLTKILRESGTMIGKIILGEYDKDKEFEQYLLGNEKDELLNRHLVNEVSVDEIIDYKISSYNKTKDIQNNDVKNIAVVDCGVKNNVIRAFLDRNISVQRVPYNYNFSKIKDIDGILISNGPGDPKSCEITIENTKKALENDIPILGICLGSQILALASGADTYKLKYGHRGLNQPCRESGTRRCYITSQNHGYAVDANTISQDWREWFVNNNDESNEGIIHISKPFFGTQFHPEASPGPDDTEIIFDMFVRAVKK